MLIERRSSHSTLTFDEEKFSEKFSNLVNISNKLFKKIFLYGSTLECEFQNNLKDAFFQKRDEILNEMVSKNYFDRDSKYFLLINNLIYNFYLEDKILSSYTKHVLNNKLFSLKATESLLENYDLFDSDSEKNKISLKIFQYLENIISSLNSIFEFLDSPFTHESNHFFNFNTNKNIYSISPNETYDFSVLLFHEANRSLPLIFHISHILAEIHNKNKNYETFFNSKKERKMLYDILSKTSSRLENIMSFYEDWKSTYNTNSDFNTFKKRYFNNLNVLKKSLSSEYYNPYPQKQCDIDDDPDTYEEKTKEIYKEISKKLTSCLI